MGGGTSKDEQANPKPAAEPSNAASDNSEAKTDKQPEAAAATSAEMKTDEAEAKQNDECKQSETAETKTETEPEAASSAGPNKGSIQRQTTSTIGDIFEGEDKIFTAEAAMSAGSALGNIFQKKATKGEVMKSHKALVFDCGTGETKAIFLKYYQKGDGQPVVEVQELNKAPATLDFLSRKNASDNEDYKVKLKKVETNKDKKGRVAFKTEEDREAARKKLNGGYWFLNEQPEGADDDKLLPQHFVDFCVQTKQKLIANNQPPDTVMIGCSAWARDAGIYQVEADALVVKLTEAGLLCKKLLQTQEGAFEAAAVAYAYNNMMSAGPDDERLPTGLIGSGGGSVQFTNNMLYPVNMDCGNRMCLEAMEDQYDDSSEEAGLASLVKCFEQSDSFASTENVSTKELHGRVRGEIEEERLRTTGQFAGDDVAKKAINSPLGGHIICISACYYGACSIGKANLKDQDMNEYPCGQIIKEMHDKIAQDKEVLRGGKHADRKARKTLFKEIANLTLQTSLFEELFSPDAMLCFKRNWTLNTDVPFRTTWTAGWYLNFLYGLNIKFPGSNKILEEYEATQAKARELLKDSADRLGNRAGEDVAMVLVDMMTVIKGMRKLALQIANPIDKFLNSVKDEFGGEAMGWPKYKIKGSKSLYRKLIGTIFELLEKNEDVPSYTPNVEECVQSIHDSLRYTLVFPRDQYTAAVKAIEERLLTSKDPAVKARAQSIRFKNFWRKNDGETTYQGINAQVCLNPVMDLEKDEKPMDPSDKIPEEDGFLYEIPAPTGAIIPNSADFIFELQIHTPESYAMKDGPGHLLYEDFRDPAIRHGSVKGVSYDGRGDSPEKKQEYTKFKEALYTCNKELYRTKRDDGTPLKEGDVVCEGLKGTKDHKWTAEEYTFVPYKPDPSIAFYKSKIEGAKWQNRLQVNKKLEAKITGKAYPHGYAV